MKAGDVGVTTGEAVSALGGPHPHVGGAAQRLRGKGLPLQTAMERVGPQVSVARYSLTCDMEILEDWSRD